MNQHKVPILLILKVCFHEAGHYVVGRCSGFSTGDCTIRILSQQGDHNGGCEIKLYRPLTTSADIIQYLEARIKVLFAGALAESMAGHEGIDNPTALKSLKLYGARDDQRKASELVQLLRNICFHGDQSETDVQEHLSKLDNRLYNEAAAQVQKEAAVIIAVGRQLAKVVKELGVEYTIPASDIEQVPEVIARFTIDGV